MFQVLGVINTKHGPRGTRQENFKNETQSETDA